MIRDIVLPRFGITETDETKIGAAAEQLERQLKLADDTLRKSRYLARDQLSLADLFLAPDPVLAGQDARGSGSAAEACGPCALVPKHECPPQLPGDDPADAGQAAA